MKSVEQLVTLVAIQNENNSGGSGDFLKTIKFMRVKMLPEVLYTLVKEVLRNLTALNELKLSGINLNHTRVVDQLEQCISRHQDDLEMLDFEDSKLQTEHLAILSDQIKLCEYLLSLKLADNPVNLSNPGLAFLVSNLQEMIENQNNALNHVDLSGMMLKFDACSKIIRSVSNSKSLCALHLSRNGLQREQKRLLVRQIGIPESDLDGSEQEQNDIVNEIFHETIKADQGH